MGLGLTSMGPVGSFSDGPADQAWKPNQPVARAASTPTHVSNRNLAVNMVVSFELPFASAHFSEAR